MFHSQSTDEVLKKLQTSMNGLSENEAQARLKKYGYNEFGKGKRRTLLDLFIAQFKNYIFILLLIAAGLAYFIGHHTDALAIGIVIVINAFFGTFLEFQADRSMEELKKLTVTKAIVLRNGEKFHIISRFLVPGDIIFVEEGGKIPADARILKEHEFETNEASLTGESRSVKKNVNTLALETPLVERNCMMYAGTFVSRGTCSAVVTATGMDSEMGQIEKALRETKGEETTLEKTMAELSKFITFAACGIVAIFFVLGFVFGRWTVEQLLIYSISIIVAAIPEGLITIVTLTLALGVKNMANEKAIVRRMHAVETLGNITCIATDKTGTITEGKMTLVKIYDGKIKDSAELSGQEKILVYSYLCNSAHLTDKGVVGEETDKALLIAGIEKGVDIQNMHTTKQISFVPFNADTKTMSGIYKINHEQIEIVKGAPESVLKMCSALESGEKITKETKCEIMKNLEFFTSSGMRVIALAYRKVPKNLVFLGLLALNDPVRKEAGQTIAVCIKAGIRILMITGDNIGTAETIAKEIGLTGKVVSWSELERMKDNEFDEALKNIAVIARATPIAKLRITERLVAQGEIIAVTGDGVNDAPALKKAHVSVVMGRTGTDVSKEVAHIVLMDDNFATLEKAIEYGRGITQNITNFLKFQITTNLGIILLSVPYLFGIQLFTPVHILWINFIIDGPPALTLGLEKPRKDIMNGMPKKKNRVINQEFVAETLNMALFMAVICFVVYFYYDHTYPEKAMTMSFNVFVFMQIFNALNLRSKTAHFYSSLFSNKWLVLAIAGVVIIQSAVIFMEPLYILFGTTLLSLTDFAIVLGVGSLVLIMGEVKKAFLRRHLM